MKLQLKSMNKEDFLCPIDGIIDYEEPIMQEKISEIKNATDNVKEQAELAFNFVRDDIEHSFDTNSKLITISATETLKKKEGICFAKSHLLAALLRGLDIPAGFCYQRVVRKGTVESGYALHGLNALYLDEVGWFRVDPRGNKEGIYSEFCTDKEKLAYPIRSELDEMDYPHVYSHPLQSVITSMNESKDCHELFYNRPEAI